MKPRFAPLLAIVIACGGSGARPPDTARAAVLAATSEGMLPYPAGAFGTSARARRDANVADVRAFLRAADAKR
ncbi:MAG: hypothetical protein ABI889_11190 [Gemmatimonadota bacterium]